MTVACSVLELMKNTPLVALKGRARARPRAKLWAKLELALPGQMKDRVALKMIEDAEARGHLRAGGIIVESTSGTLAEGLARVAAIKGYRLIIVTDARIDPASVAKLKAFGAHIEIVRAYHPEGGWQYSRLQRLREILDTYPGAFWPRQYDTGSNPAAYESVAEEIFTALGDIAALVGPVGSGGSLSGTTRFLREHAPGLRAIAVDAVGSVQFSQPNQPRLQSGHGNSIVATNINYPLIDEVHWVGDGEAFAACRELARREGIFAGGSSGAAYIAASWIAEQFEADQHVVVLFPDRGDRYANTIYSDSYLNERGVAGIEAAAQPVRIQYGVEVAARWSYATLPHHSSVAYYDPAVLRSDDLARSLGL